MTLAQSREFVLKALMKFLIRERTKRAKAMAKSWKMACRVVEGEHGQVFFYDLRPGRKG